MRPLKGKPRGEPFQPSFTGLLRLPPRPLLVAGLVFLAAGVLLTLLLWGRGVIWGFALFAVVAGLFLFVSGLAGRRSQAKREERAASIDRRRDEILAGMIDAKKQGKNPVRWLNDQGILDSDIRTSLMEEMNGRVQSG